MMGDDAEDLPCRSNVVVTASSVEMGLTVAKARTLLIPLAR